MTEWHDDDEKLQFETSGSTGESVTHEKTMRQLKAEVKTLLKFFPQRAPKKWISFVPSVHLYGYLFSVLLPRELNSKVKYLVGNAGVMEAPSEDYNGAVIIAVPAQWPLVKNILRDCKPYLVFFSGGAFGAQREAEAIEFFHSTGRLHKLVEVFGSTETGGIGYRQIGVDEPGRFRLFDNVRLRAFENHTEVVSSHTDGRLVLISDKLKVSQDSFTHAGRSDLIFKCNSTRISASTLEKNLSLLFSNARVICDVEEETVGKGATVTAYVESNPFDLVQARQEWASKFPNLPFPNHVQFVSNFPTSEMGKTGLAQLRVTNTGSPKGAKL